MCNILEDYSLKLKQYVAIELKLIKLIDLEETNVIVMLEKRRLENERTQVKMSLMSVECALEQMEEEDKYLIIQRYVVGMEWNDLEVNYNRNFRKKPEIKLRAMQKKLIKATNKLNEIISILEPRKEMEIEKNDNERTNDTL